MNKFLDRNTLPKFQERLDLAASELNGMEDIYCEAINELAGRLYIITNMVTDPEERAKYASEPNYLILDKLNEISNKIVDLRNDFTALQTSVNETITTMSDNYAELEERLNNLDDAAAHKKDLNTVLYRTGRN